MNCRIWSYFGCFGRLRALCKKYTEQKTNPCLLRRSCINVFHFASYGLHWLVALLSEYHRYSSEYWQQVVITWIKLTQNRIQQQMSHFGVWGPKVLMLMKPYTPLRRYTYRIWNAKVGQLVMWRGNLLRNFKKSCLCGQNNTCFHGTRVVMRVDTQIWPVYALKP